MLNCKLKNSIAKAPIDMRRTHFNFNDICADCVVEERPYTLDERALGLRITIPTALQNQYPFNASAYSFLQFLRDEIHRFGFIEFPNLKLNPKNHTLAQRSPEEHRYSSNPFLTDYCQQPHQDTPPYPTAFWLAERRQFFATWMMSTRGLEHFSEHQRNHPQLSIVERHKFLVPRSLAEGWGLLVNQQPGLILIDNSQHQQLFHARTSNFKAMEQHTDCSTDTAMYAFNEVGLMHYMDQLDSRRGQQHRDEQERLEIAAFMQQEAL